MNTLEYGMYYHIYNRGNNREDLFKTDEDHVHFLRLYEKYIEPVADTLAWVLMKNHFHLLVRIKDENEIFRYRLSNADRSNDAVRFATDKWETLSNLTASEGPVSVIPDTSPEGPVSVIPDTTSEKLVSVKRPNPVLHFSHLFNAYAKYYNKLYHRTGSLFQRSFKRIEITSDTYFRQLVVYIHTNPIHHKIAEDFTEYKWSSFQTIISTNPSRINNDAVIEWFGNRDNFIEIHNQKLEIDFMDDMWLE